MNEVLVSTDLPLKPFIKGKVRDTYEIGNDLLMVATDRLSAFDVVLPAGIPDKGRVLNLLSAFWFKKTQQIIANHLIEVVSDVRPLSRYFPGNEQVPGYLAERSMVVRKASRLPVECVVRGYLAGSGWTEYLRNGSVCGIRLPEGMTESQKLPEPIFTPTSKAESGHDMPLNRSQVSQLVGARLAAEVEQKSLDIYNYCLDYALTRGFIIADTKIEFGLYDGKMMLIDELLTPDSSRFWDTGKYRPGQPQDSFDKQPVRDWLENSGWNKEPPAPELPDEVVESTSRRYRQAYERLTGQRLLNEPD
jgi:phosphoribosylaminoimidazole-succinocarboxamide synthase